MIKIESPALKQFQRQVSSAQKAFAPAAVKALSTTQRGMKTEATRAASELYTAGKRRIGDGFIPGKVDRASLSFVLTARRKVIQLQEYKHSFTKRRGVTAQVLRGKPALHIPRAFKATAGNFGGSGSKARIFQRVGASAYPIKVLSGPSPGDMINQPTVFKRISTFAVDKLGTEMARQVARSLGG